MSQQQQTWLDARSQCAEFDVGRVKLAHVPRPVFSARSIFNREMYRRVDFVDQHVGTARRANQSFTRLSVARNYDRSIRCVNAKCERLAPTSVRHRNRRYSDTVTRINHARSNLMNIDTIPARHLTLQPKGAD